MQQRLDRGLPAAPAAAVRVPPGQAGRGSTGPGSAGHGAMEPVEVRRSARRRRTVTAYRENGRTVVLIPAAFTAAEERRWVDRMVAKLQTREERRTRGLASDDQLMARAGELSAAWLGGHAVPVSVRWVDNQNRRWGSCTPADRTIRLSSRLRGVPEYVVDYVLVHELAHLLEPNHDERFWALVRAYPQVERALGFLEGVESRLAGARPPVDDDDELEPGAVD